MPESIVSIVMPVYNASLYLNEAIESIQNQSFKNWELWVVNDFSTDSSLFLLQKLANKDSRIKILENKEKGIVPALTLALKYCSGTYITRMDADDIMPVYKLKSYVDAIQKVPSKTILTSKVQYFAEHEVSDGYKLYENWLNERVKKQDFYKHIYRECVVASPNWFMRTSELRMIHGFADLQYPEDYDLLFKWYKAGFKIVGLPFLGLLWREHPQRTSRNIEQYNQQYFFKLKVPHFLKNEVKNNDTIVLWGKGKKAQITAKILKEHQVDFIQMDLNDKGGYASYKDIESVESPKLLLAIYPKGEHKKSLETYLEKHNLIFGKNCWYL